MSADDHRAPIRLHTSTRPPHRTFAPPAVPSRRSSSAYPEEDIIETKPNDEGQYAPVPEPDEYGAPAAYQPKRKSGELPRVAAEPPPPVYEARESTAPVYESSHESGPQGGSGDMTTQEQYELLLQNVQFYDDEWKLASIRAIERNHWLTAYLIPKNSKMDLRTAISKNQVLVITIDNRGNTDIKEPKQRGILRRLVRWLYGE